MTAYDTISDGQQITIDGTILSLPCLAGEDVSRNPGRLCVEVIDGKLRDAQYGDPLEIDWSGNRLAGWGPLDGESVCVGNGTWHVDVPRTVMDRLVAKYGLTT